MSVAKFSSTVIYVVVGDTVNQPIQSFCYKDVLILKLLNVMHMQKRLNRHNHGLHSTDICSTRKKKEWTHSLEMTITCSTSAGRGTGVLEKKH